MKDHNLLTYQDTCGSVDVSRHCRSFSSESSASERRLKMKRIRDFIDITSSPNQLEACVKWAVFEFQAHFHDFIAQLLMSFPPGHVTSEGQAFWTGSKRCPRVLELDLSDETQRHFLLACTNLCAAALGVSGVADEASVVRAAAKVEPPVFHPTLLKIETTKEKTVVTETGVDDEETCTKLEQEILDLLPKATNFNPSPIEFEKDDDSNFHIDFIVAAGNLRARNYTIQEAVRWKAKMIAGKIIPAIASVSV